MNCRAMPKSCSLTAAIAACRSSFALAHDPDLVALDLRLDLEDRLAHELRDLLGLLVGDPGHDFTVWRTVPLAAGSTAPGCSAFSGTCRFTAFSSST